MRKIYRHTVPAIGPKATILLVLTKFSIYIAYTNPSTKKEWKEIRDQENSMLQTRQCSYKSATLL